MTHSADELWSMLREAYDLPYGSGQIALVEEVVRHADAAEIDELRFAGRMMATSAYIYGGEPAKSFVTFSWCLAEYDRHPERYDRDDEATLLWHFKYMVAGLTKFPEVPLRRTYEVLDDMERRYRAGGHSLHAVYSHRWLLAEHVGDQRAADEWYAMWCAAPRDSNSDCVGCDPTGKVRHLAARGRDAEAVDLAAPVLTGHLTCAEQPQMILTGLLMPYVRTGRLAEAADAHRRAYRELRGKIADLGSIADHILFCALTGNEVRGLEILERHLSWLDRAPTPYSALRFAAAGGLLLRRLVQTGHGRLTVHRAVTGDRTGEDVPVGQLAVDLVDHARRLADRFDERNGTTHFGDWVEKTLAAQPLVAELPLNAVDRAVRRAKGDSALPTPVRVAAVDAALPDEPVALLDYAERMVRLQRVPDAAAAWHRFDERVVAPEPALAARRLDGQGMLAAGGQRLDEAAAVWQAAAEAYRTLGDEVSALVATAREAAAAASDEDSYDEALARIDALTGQIVDHPDADVERRGGALLRLATVLGRGGRFEQAALVAEQAADVVDSGTWPLLEGEIEGRRAHFLFMLDQLDEATLAAAAAREHYVKAAGDSPALAIVCLIQGHAMAGLDDMEGAAEAFDTAVRCAGEPTILAQARLGRGRAQLAAGHPAEAIDDLVEGVADQVAQGDEEAAAMLRFDLAMAYHGTGQLLEAAEAAESAVEALDRLEAQDTADRARYLLSRVYRDSQEPDRAVAQLEQLAANLDGFDNLPARAQMYEEAAQVLYQIDRDAQAANRFATAADAYRRAELHLDELRVRRWQALSLHWAEQPDTAVAVLAQADALAAALPAEEPAVLWEKAMLGYDAARVYIGAEQGEAALSRLDGVAAAFRDIGSFAEALHADLLLGELLLRLDRAGDAEPVLRQVLAGAPDDSQTRQNAAWLLSETLESLGRADEAEAIRRDYDLGM